MSTTFSMPRADYRAFPFSMEIDGVAKDIQGYTFVFTLKKKVTDSDSEDKILFEEIVQIPEGTAVYSGLFEVLSTDSDLTPGTYWLEMSTFNDITKPITADPIAFKITERERKEMPTV